MFIFRTLGWYAIKEDDQNQLYFPTLQINEAKLVSRTRKYGPTDEDFFWFFYPHNFEFQQALKVEIYCTFDFKSFPFDSHECRLSKIFEQFNIRFASNFSNIKNT